MMGDGQYNPGFRISINDIIVLVVGMVGTAALCSVVGTLGLIVAFVVGHFFLFCNVFRTARNLEFAWAGVFVALSGATVVLQTPGWAVTIVATLCASVFVILIEARKPSYHGIGWKLVNPNLRDWWDANVENGHEPNAF
jgi:hypothetical protein